MINKCSKITHIDGVIGLHVADLGDITVNILPMQALRIVIDAHWTTQVDVIQSFMAKCKKLEFLELVGGSGAAVSAEFENFLKTAISDSSRQVKSLKIIDFDLGEVDVNVLTSAFPNLTALAIDMRPTSRQFLACYLQSRNEPLHCLDLTFEKWRNEQTLESFDDLDFLGETPERFLAREVIVKVEIRDFSSWKSEYALCFPEAKSLTVVFAGESIRRQREERLHQNHITFKLDHPECLKSRYGFGVDDEERETFDAIGRAMLETAPWIETCYVGLGDRTSFQIFGVREQYSSETEKRALDIMRSENILRNIPDEKPAESMESDSGWYSRKYGMSEYGLADY